MFILLKKYFELFELPFLSDINNCQDFLQLSFF